VTIPERARIRSYGQLFSGGPGGGIVGRFAVEYQKHLDEFATLTTEQMG
jgi:hypothetical protein